MVRQMMRDQRGGSPGIWEEVLAGSPLSSGDPYRYHMYPSMEEQEGGRRDLW